MRWLWDGRLAVGILALLAGREALGKSSFAYWLVARITRGELPGEHHGQPRAVLICATEDSWEHTIVPRLIAVGADLDLVYRVEVVNADEIHVGLSLPRDLLEVEAAATDIGAKLLLLDPLMSRISTGLDPHKDAEVRRALEPIKELAERVELTVLGIIHLNKTGSIDILDRVMGSKAFVAVARAVCAIVPDPDDEQDRRRLFGIPKNNLGRSDLPSIQFTIETTPVRTDDGATTGVARVTIGDETATTIAEAMERNGEDPDARTRVADAKTWLTEYLTEHSHADSRDVKAAADQAKIAERTLHRARKALRVVVTNLSVSPLRTVWSLPARPRAVAEPPRARAHAQEDNYVGIVGIDTGQSVSDDQGEMSNCANYANGAMPPRARARGDWECSCQTPKARRLADGRWFCSTCGRQIPTEEGSP